jgi:hypothetical protein
MNKPHIEKSLIMDVDKSKKELPKGVISNWENVHICE